MKKKLTVEESKLFCVEVQAMSLEYPNLRLGQIVWAVIYDKADIYRHVPADLITEMYIHNELIQKVVELICHKNAIPFVTSFFEKFNEKT